MTQEAAEQTTAVPLADWISQHPDESDPYNSAMVKIDEATRTTVEQGKANFVNALHQLAREIQEASIRNTGIILSDRDALERAAYSFEESCESLGIYF